MSWIAVSTRHFQMSFLEFFRGVLEAKRNDEEKTQERLATTYTHTHTFLSHFKVYVLTQMERQFGESQL